MTRQLGLLLTCFFALHATVAQAATLNEFRISAGADDDTNNFFELAGTPGESLDGLTVLSISNEFNPGEISFAFDLSGLSIPADGYFLASTDDIFYGANELQTGVDFFGSPQTFAIVSGFSGAMGDDTDIDDDGTPETTPWTSVVDAVALIDGDGNPDFIYAGGVAVGPDGNFPPAHGYRIPNGNGAWVQGTFGDTSIDTPGVANVPEPSAVVLLLSGIALLMFRRK